MKSIVVAEYGGPEKLALAETALPQPGPDDVLIRLRFAGINFIDTYIRSGLYKRSDTYAQTLPMTIGMEGAGIIEAVGKNVGAFSPGDPVAYCLELGSYAEFATVPAWKIVRIPDTVPLEIAAALQLQGSTAHYLSTSLAPLNSESSCLVHAGAGGLGQLLVQLAKIRGARVFTTVGSAEKAEEARACGADHVILYREEDFADRILELTDGIGVDVVYDSIGRDTIAKSLKSVKRRGIISNNGNASGAIGSLDPLELAEAGSVFFTRPHLADYIATAEERQWRAAELFELYADGKLNVNIGATLPLAKAGEAHRLIESRQTTGKLLLAI